MDRRLLNIMDSIDNAVESDMETLYNGKAEKYKKEEND